MKQEAGTARRGEIQPPGAVPAFCSLLSASCSLLPSLRILDLPLTPYARALELQRTLAQKRIEGEEKDDILVLVEHPAVVTLGRKSQRGEDNTATAEFLRARGVELFEVERGGDATFHGPGQLVGYPILNLEGHRKDLHWYLRSLEEVLIRALGWWGIPAERQQGLTGVWTQGRKIASIGVHARGWVTWHGFALNVTTDLAYFDLIVPCGIQGVVMTSVARELGGRAPSPEEARRDVVRAFRDVFAFEDGDVATEAGLSSASHSRIAS
jgi:lipoate-protein ligase B